MFIRKYIVTSQKTGKTYKYFSIVENMRINGSITQKTLLKLDSDFDLPEEKWGMLINKIKSYINNTSSLTTHTYNAEYDILARSLANKIIANSIIESEKFNKNLNKSYITVDEEGVDSRQFRSVGIEHVAINGTQRIRLLDIFKSVGLEEDKALLGVASVVARMVHPSSERETCRWLNENSSLCELLNISVQSDNALHRINDLIYNYKDIIELSFRKHPNNLLDDQNIISFYDLTNTYFEGSPKADKAKRGFSKEKRYDCPLVTLAVILDFSGNIVHSEVFSGNVSEPKTMEEMLNKLQASKAGTVVMDRGIATTENIKWLDEHGYTYLVVNREQKRIFDFTKAISYQTRSGNEILFYKELVNNNKEARLYCYSEKRSFKENAIWEKKCKTFESSLKKLDEGLSKKTRTKKDKIEVERKIGRLFETYSGVSQHYSVNVEDNSLTKLDQDPLLATKIIWTKNPVPGSMLDLPGVYSLCSNNIKMSPIEMWFTFSHLTDIESVFRSLKSDLSLRPIYHHKDFRIESHIFITVLAYQAVNSIRNALKLSGIYESWPAIKNSLASHGRSTVILPKIDGSIRYIRKTNAPESWQVDIYTALRITTRPGATTMTTRPPPPPKT